jgi:hypothetical protein
VSVGGEPRAAAGRAVSDVARRGRSLDEALGKSIVGLADADRALVAQLAYGTLRAYPRLDRWVDLLLARPLPERDIEVHDLLAVGLYQLEDTRVPDHSIWDHLDLTSAFAGAFAADPDQEVALLTVSLGPVQSFIAAARSTIAD